MGSILLSTGLVLGCADEFRITTPVNSPETEFKPMRAVPVHPERVELTNTVAEVKTICRERVELFNNKQAQLEDLQVSCFRTDSKKNVLDYQTFNCKNEIFAEQIGAETFNKGGKCIVGALELKEASKVE